MSISQLRIGTLPRTGLKTWVAVVLGVALGALAFGLYYSARGSVERGPRHDSASRAVSSDKSRSPGRSAHGLTITDVIDGRIAYTLEVKHVRFEAGPLGFFRVGFRQTAVLDDVRLRVELPAGTTGVSAAIPAMESAFTASLGHQGQKVLTLGPIGGFAGVSVSRLQIEVVKEGREVLALDSQRASVDLRRRQLDLEGQARVSADGGARILEGEKLHVSLEKQEVWTGGEVWLRTPEGRTQVHGFRSDLFLRTGATRLAVPSRARIGVEQRVDKTEMESRR